MFFADDNRWSLHRPSGQCFLLTITGGRCMGLMNNVFTDDNRWSLHRPSGQCFLLTMTGGRCLIMVDTVFC